MRPLLLLALLAAGARAQAPDPVVAPDSLRPAVLAADARPGTDDVLPPDTLAERAVPQEVPPQLTFIGYSFTRATTSNVAPTNDVLQGQVIGRLFGPNSTRTGTGTANYIEQRFVPLFVYRPRVLDGLATFRGLFKMDYTWGDQAYGVGGNRGGGLNAGQVNLQTLMANVEVRPSRRANVVVGLQRIFDGARDPNVTPLDQFFQSGYKLAFWGTQGVGISTYLTPTPATRARVGYYPLWENLIARDDDASLFMLDAEHLVTPRLEVGADAWYLRDRSRGAGGVSILGQGVNSALASYNGATQFGLPQDHTSDLVWLGTRASYDHGFALGGRWWADAFVLANLGRIRPANLPDVSVAGLSTNARVAYRYGRTAGDHAAVEALHTTGDANGAADSRVSSVVTGNAYGSPVGIYTSGRALLLFPDEQVVNRYYSAVHDVGHMGYGVTGLFATVSRDLIPNRFTAKLGAATAFTSVAPAGGGRLVGTEINAELRYHLGVFLTLGLNAGYLATGSFYDAPAAVYEAPGTPAFDTRPANPWVVFTTLSWLMF